MQSQEEAFLFTWHLLQVIEFSVMRRHALHSLITAWNTELPSPQSLSHIFRQKKKCNWGTLFTVRHSGQLRARSGPALVALVKFNLFRLNQTEH